MFRIGFSLSAAGPPHDASPESHELPRCSKDLAYPGSSARSMSALLPAILLVTI
jgi:hypothetical protein